MNSEKPDQYGVEPESEATADANARPAIPPAPVPSPSSSSSPQVAKPHDVSPLPLELEPQSIDAHTAHRAQPVVSVPSAEEKKSSVKDLDVCPNCGASMRGTDVLVCLRCGFDLKTMRVMKTVTGETTATNIGDEGGGGEGGGRLPPLVVTGMGDMWLPAAMAGLSGLVLMIFYLAGARGLYPEVEAAVAAGVAGVTGEIHLATRFEALLKCIVLIGMWTACGLGALAFIAHLLSQSLGNVKLAATRMLGIVTTMRLVTLMNLRYPTLEWTTEAALQLIIFTGLSIVLFKLKPRDGATLVCSAVILFMLLWICANVVKWATV